MYKTGFQAILTPNDMLKKPSDQYFNAFASQMVEASMTRSYKLKYRAKTPLILIVLQSLIVVLLDCIELQPLDLSKSVAYLQLQTE